MGEDAKGINGQIGQREISTVQTINKGDVGSTKTQDESAVQA